MVSAVFQKTGTSGSRKGQRSTLNEKNSCYLVKGTVSQDFLLLVFFLNQFPPPPPQIIPFRPFRIFSKIRGDIRESRCTTGINDIGGKLATGVNYTGGKYATGINNASENSGKICHWCRWYRWQICHRCRWYRWCTLTREYLREFSKKFETV